MPVVFIWAYISNTLCVYKQRLSEKILDKGAIKKENGRKYLTWSSHRAFTEPLHEGHGENGGEGTISETKRALGIAGTSLMLL